jgi:hypothetical protein
LGVDELLTAAGIVNDFFASVFLKDGGGVDDAPAVAAAADVEDEDEGGVDDDDEDDKDDDDEDDDGDDDDEVGVEGGRSILDAGSCDTAAGFAIIGAARCGLLGVRSTTGVAASCVGVVTMLLLSFGMVSSSGFRPGLPLLMPAAGEVTPGGTTFSG